MLARRACLSVCSSLSVFLSVCSPPLLFVCCYCLTEQTLTPVNVKVLYWLGGLPGRKPGQNDALPDGCVAMPKSPSFTRSDAVRRKFAGFMSLRGTTPSRNCRGRRLSCGRVDDVEATRHRDNAIDADFEVQKQTLSQHQDQGTRSPTPHPSGVFP